jgi:hypothetical protein
MVERLVADMVSTDISRMSQTQQKIFADFENTGKFASPAVGEGAVHSITSKHRSSNFSHDHRLTEPALGRIQ